LSLVAIKSTLPPEKPADPPTGSIQPANSTKSARQE
jgi:hypothetical protein